MYHNDCSFLKNYPTNPWRENVHPYNTGEGLNNLEFHKSSMWNKFITTLPNSNIKTEADSSLFIKKLQTHCFKSCFSLQQCIAVDCVIVTFCVYNRLYIICVLLFIISVQ